jgi:GTPase Era involved in 16S rRNA processing
MNRVRVDRIAPTRDDGTPGGNAQLPAPPDTVPRPGAAVYSIGVFGRRGSGKTTLVRRLAGLPPIPPLPAAGAPVPRTIRLPGAGEVTIVESPALEDCAVHQAGMRDRIRAGLAGVDLALLVMDPRAGFGEHEEGLLLQARAEARPVIVILSKRDAYAPQEQLVEFLARRSLPVIGASAWTGEGLASLAAAVTATLPIHRRS